MTISDFFSELETVKKGTPLYGQPAWWGEDTEENSEFDLLLFSPSALGLYNLP